MQTNTSRICPASVALLLALLLSVSVPRTLSAQQRPSLDIFAGIDVGLVDNNFFRQYNVLLGVMPGVKLNMGNHWQLAAQGEVLLVNTYNNNLRRAFLTMLVASKEFRLGPLALKGSAGLFSSSRYGVDVKAFLPVSPWLAFEAQAGCTGLLTMATGMFMSPMGRFTGTVGADIYFPRSNTQLRGVVGSYVYTDWGFECEAMRHFDHATVGLYARWSNLAGGYGTGVALPQAIGRGLDGGFRVTLMLPPYRLSDRRVRLRPASNFTFLHLVRGSGRFRDANVGYHTDPEENRRQGWFSSDIVRWGASLHGEEVRP